MRMRGLFFGVDRRNRGFLLEDPRPIDRYSNPLDSNDMDHNGYELLSRADPGRTGRPPVASGSVGSERVSSTQDNYPGPDNSFEQ